MVARVAIGKVPAQVSLPKGAKNRISERVSRHVGVRMTAEPVGMRDLDPAQNELASLHQGMKIESLSNSEFHRSVRGLSAFSAVRRVSSASAGGIATAALT